MSNKKIRYLVTFIILFIIECLIAIFFNEGFIRENVGDILVVPCIYTLIRIVFPKLKHLSLYVLIFAIIIELMQLLNITTLISSKNRMLGIALGGTFDMKDIVCYIVGYIMLFIIEIYYNKRGD